MVAITRILVVFLTTLLFYSFAYLLYSESLPFDEAFRVDVKKIGDNIIRVECYIADGYHLYRDKVSISLENGARTILGKIIFPKGSKEHNNILGDYYVYKEKLIIDIPVIKWGDGNTNLVINYQGCKASGSCYPPLSKIFSVHTSQKARYNDVSHTISSTEQLLKSRNIFIIVISFFVFGILLSLTPCVLPMIPVLVSIIIGQKKMKTSRALTLSLSYVFGIAITYTTAGVLTAVLGNSVQSLFQNFWVVLTCSLIFILLSLNLFGVYELQLPYFITNKLNSLSCKVKGGSYIGVLLMGAISSLVVSPCVSAPLAGALLYIASTGDAILGGSALFALSFGMGVLLVITGVTGGGLFIKAGSWMIAVRYCLGVLMLIVAIWLVSRVISSFITNILWTVLIAGVGFTLYINTLKSAKNKLTLSKFQRLSALMIIPLGIIMFLNLLLTGDLIPQKNIFLDKSLSKDLSTKKLESGIFNVVTTLKDLEKFIAQGIREGKPIIIDYYADWCTSCKVQDSTVFNNSEVQQLLKSFIVVRANITNNNDNTKALKNKYNVFLPPYVVFLDNKGHELKNAAIAGDIGFEELSYQMKMVLSKN